MRTATCADSDLLSGFGGGQGGLVVRPETAAGFCGSAARVRGLRMLSFSQHLARVGDATCE
jgi:hypothetical protein